MAPLRAEHRCPLQLSPTNLYTIGVAIVVYNAQLQLQIFSLGGSYGSKPTPVPCIKYSELQKHRFLMTTGLIQMKRNSKPG